MINLTRVIVAGENNSGSVQIQNKGLQPTFIQMWIDNGISEMEHPLEKIKVPFVIESPVFRLEANTNQWVRIYYSGTAGQVPSDRESMFWLNVLEVPPKTSAANRAQNELQIAFRSRIKLFYRPAGIPASAQGVEQKLSFLLQPKGDTSVLQVINPTPFHVTFLTLELGEHNSKQRVDAVLSADGVVAPKESVEVPLNHSKMLSAKDRTVFFSILDDFGSTVEGVFTLP